MLQGPGTNRLLALVEASEKEKESRGILYTPHEILRQPSTWRKTYRICTELRPELSQFFRTVGIGAEPGARPVVFLVGAGTSDYVGRALTPLLRRLWGCEVWAVPSTDLLTNFEDLVFTDRPYLWISFSRSGDSSEGLAVLETALQKYPKVKHLVVTCNQQGRMAEVCRKKPGSTFLLALDDSANDLGLAMTSSYTTWSLPGIALPTYFSR